MKYYYGQRVEYLSYETPEGVWKPGTYDYYRNGLHYVLADNNGTARVRDDQEVRPPRADYKQEEQKHE